MTLLWKLAAVAAIAGALFAGGYMKGKTDGRIEQLRDTVEAYEKREAIDGDVQDLDAYDLCVELGGMPDECEQLRRVDEAAGGERPGQAGG